MSRKRTPSGYATQLSLFDDIPVEKQEPFPEQEEYVIDPYGNRLPAVVFHASHYANGDTRPDALERLAETILGDITIVHYGPPVCTVPEKDKWKLEYGHSLRGYERYWYRCVSSGIVDRSVWGAYIYEKCCMDLTRWRNPYEDEDDDV